MNCAARLGQTPFRGTITKTWRQFTSQADPPHVLRARCIVPLTILTVVRIVTTNWNLGRPLEDAIREQMCSSSGATVAATFILFPLKRLSLLPQKRRSQRVTELLFGSAYRKKESRRYVGPNWLRVVFGCGSSHSYFCHLNRCSPSLVRLGG